MRTVCSSLTVRSLVLAFIAGLCTTGAHAINPFGRGDVDSMALLNAIPPGHFELTPEEQLLILLADPPVSELSSIGFTVNYDPSRFTFVSALSGPVCEFSVAGSCPAPSAVYGSFLLSSLPVVQLDTFGRGSPLPGSTLLVSNDPVAGTVSVDYRLATPLILDGADRNFFAFTFSALQPYNPFQTIATFYDRPGSHDFNQTGASCSANPPGCGSDTPVYGFDVRPVPEPDTYALMLAGLGVLGLAARRHKVRGRLVGAGLA